MATRQNNAEGQSSGTAASAANSGGASGDAFNAVTKTGTGAVTFDSAQFMHGTRSYHVTAAAGETAFVTYSGANDVSAAFRFYIIFNTLPGIAQDLIQLRNASGVACKVQLTAGNKFAVVDSASVGTTFASTLLTLVKYRVELECTPATATTGYVAGRYFLGDAPANQDSLHSSTTANAGTANLTLTQAGKITSATATGDFWIDDIAFNPGSAAPLGAIRAPRPVMGIGQGPMRSAHW